MLFSSPQIDWGQHALGTPMRYPDWLSGIFCFSQSIFIPCFLLAALKENGYTPATTKNEVDRGKHKLPWRWQFLPTGIQICHHRGDFWPKIATVVAICGLGRQTSVGAAQECDSTVRNKLPRRWQFSPTRIKNCHRRGNFWSPVKNCHRRGNF